MLIPVLVLCCAPAATASSIGYDTRDLFSFEGVGIYPAHSTDSLRTDTTISTAEQYRILYWVGGIGLTLAGTRRSIFGSIRYNSVGAGIGTIDGEDYPGAVQSFPPGEKVIHDIRFRGRTTGIDARIFHDISPAFSVYGTLGYYWNSYASFARSVRTGDYLREQSGREWWPAAGLGVIYDIDAAWPRPWMHYAIGLELHSLRGIALVVGFGWRQQL